MVKMLIPPKVTHKFNVILVFHLKNTFTGFRMLMPFFDILNTQPLVVCSWQDCSICFLHSFVKKKKEQQSPHLLIVILIQDYLFVSGFHHFNTIWVCMSLFCLIVLFINFSVVLFLLSPFYNFHLILSFSFHHLAVITYGLSSFPLTI